MLKKLMIRTWFGELPPWTREFVDHVLHLRQYGWDFMLFNDFKVFRLLVHNATGIWIPESVATRKAGDYDPLLADIFKSAVEGYDYWGHFNLDAVYGRLDRWIPDDFLKNLEIFANDPGAICGPFTVYKNIPKINQLYKDSDTWQWNLKSPDFMGWDERDFDLMVHEKVFSGKVTMGSGFFQAHDHMSRRHEENPIVKIWADGTLIDGVTDREIMMYHFNKHRKWPVIK